MRHPHLLGGYSRKSQTDEELSREEGAVRVHADATERITLKEFCSAVNVADAKAKPETIGKPVERCIHETQQWISTLQSIPNDNWCARWFGTCNESRQISNAELAVAIGECQVRIASRGKSWAKGSPIPTIDFVAHQANNPTVSLHEQLCHRSGVITGAVINENDLIRWRKRWERGQRIGDKRLQVVGLVMTWEKEGELL
jgi:hypothetical protein